MADRQQSRRAFLGAAAATLGAGLSGCSAPVGSQATPRPPAARGEPYTEVYREAVGSVVLVEVAGPGGRSQGSGFVLDTAGRVITNQHVVAGGARLDLRYSRGGWRTARVLGTDVYSDLAVLAVDDPPGYATPLALVDAVPAIGTEVVVIGSPFGLEKSLSAGIVSGVHRSIPTRGGFTIPDAVQTDAAINPGNSGGPLVTLDGEAVGVIRSGGGENIGFAVSAALVERVAPTLIRTGHYRHPYLGIGILDVSPTVAAANGLERARGVLVVQVLEDGPAAGSLRGSRTTRRVDGVEVPVGGDVIVGVDGTRIPASGALGRHLALETRPGETVSVAVVRDGEETAVDVTLGARPPP